MDLHPTLPPKGGTTNCLSHIRDALAGKYGSIKAIKKAGDEQPFPS
jgi:hypothetical protein